MISALPVLPGWNRLTWPDGHSASFWLATVERPWIEAHWTPEDARRGEPPLMRLTMGGLLEFRIAVEACCDPRGVGFGG